MSASDLLEARDRHPVDVLLPHRIQAGLAANDRLKYYLTLLQEAAVASAGTRRQPTDLQAARTAAGVRDASFDRVIGHSRAEGDGSLLVPESGRIRVLIFEDLQAMLAPLADAGAIDPGIQESADAYAQRLRLLEAAIPPFEDDRVPPGAIDALTARRTGNRDTVHQLVMDMHQKIGKLQSLLPLHEVDGASTWGLTTEDESHVRAFMSGLQSTAALKFDHPGLATSAARAGERLSIQNDLGTTDAHIVVVHVEALSATIVYSDIHRRRVQFLQQMLAERNVAWEASTRASASAPILLIGRHRAETDAALDDFLAFFASRLVFLIDWNRARKQLGRFVRKPEAVGILEWAAARNAGHRAFLQAGGAGLVYTALERAASRRPLAGGRLDDLLGRRETTAFLRSVLQIASRGLTAGHSTRLIQDEVEAELLPLLATAPHNGLGLVADHAAYVAALSERVYQMVLASGRATPADETRRGASLAKRWEVRADELVRRLRQTEDASRTGDVLRRLLQHGDDAADAFEEVAFLLTMVPESAPETAREALRQLAELARNGCRDYVRCVEHAKYLPRQRSANEIDEFLESVDRVLAFERATDAAERAARVTMLGACRDFRELYVLTAAARGFEQAADALAHCALTARDYAVSVVASYA